MFDSIRRLCGRKTILIVYHQSDDRYVMLMIVKMVYVLNIFHKGGPFLYIEGLPFQKRCISFSGD